MDHGQGPGAARGSKERQRHRGREDPRPASQEEWSTGKVGVTIARPDYFCLAVAFPRYRGHFLIPSSRQFSTLWRFNERRLVPGPSTAGTRAARLSRIPLSNRTPCSFRQYSDSRLADKVAARIPAALVRFRNSLRSGRWGNSRERS